MPPVHSKLSSAANFVASNSWANVATTLRGRDRRALACVCKVSRDGVADSDLEVAGSLAPKLNGQQRSMFGVVALRRAPCYVMGAAGVGKTHTVKLAVQHLVREGAGVQICAPTACAAQRASVDGVVGKTLHVLFNIRSCKRHRCDPPYRLSSGKRLTEDDAEGMDEAGSATTGMYPTAFLTPEVVELLSSIETLVLDEVSMCDVDMIELVEQSLRFARQCELPFGGVGMVCMGDFAQLPPVVRLPRPDGKLYAFEHDKWGFLRVVRLTQVMRQADATFSAVLGRLRDGRPSQTDCDWLWVNSDRSRTHEAEHAIFWSNRQSNARNTVFYNRNTNEEHVLRPTYGVQVGREGYMSYTQAVDHFGDRIRFPFVEDLRLKVGCRVRCTRNIYATGRVLVLANGATGVVADVQDGQVSVRLDSTGDVIEMPLVCTKRTQKFKSHAGESV